MTNSEEISSPIQSKESIAIQQEFIKSFYRLLKLVKIHDDQNKTVIKCLKAFAHSLSVLMQNEDKLLIQIVNQRLYIQEQKLNFSIGSGKITNGFVRFFEDRDIMGICFYNAINQAPPEQVISFFRMLNKTKNHQEPLKWLLKEMEGGEFPWTDIVKETTSRNPIASGEENDDWSMEWAWSGRARKQAKLSYSRALTSVKEIAEKLSVKRRAGVRKTTRVIQSMVDMVLTEQAALLGMSTIRDYDDYTYTHSVNVSILAMCLGKQINLSRNSLTRLGLASLFHDLGKVDVPKGILNKPGKLTDIERIQIERHSLHSVRQILKLQASRHLKASILIPPFEHHLKYDMTGYPRTKRNKPISLFGRILAIADVFDAITSPRIYRREAMSQDRALGYMLKCAGKDFDPILLKVFINMMGIYPVGTLVKLDSGELGLVSGTTAGKDDARPGVVLLKPNGKKGFEKVGHVSLSQRDENSGTYLRNIVKSMHPSKYNIQPAMFLF